MSNEAEVWRLFLAISLPEPVKGAIEEAQSEFRTALQGNPVRWTRSDQLHLTLRFLGNVAVNYAPKIASAVQQVCLNYSSMKLRAEGIGFFPNERRPRIVWTGIKEVSDQLAPLHAALNAATINFTEEKLEKDFRAHVTLGRVREIRRPDAEILEKTAARFAVKVFGEWVASGVDLFRSELLAEGAKHQLVAAAPFRGG